MIERVRKTFFITTHYLEAIKEKNKFEYNKVKFLYDKNLIAAVY